MKKMRRMILEGKKIFIGLEDSKKTWRLNVRYAKMEVHQVSMPADYNHLKHYIENHFPDCDVSVMYEAGFKGFELHDKLVTDGMKCVVTPPNKVTQAKDSRVKTDKRDARRLAKNLENGDYVACHVPDRERREDRDVSRAYEQVKKDICRTKNRLRGMLKFHGLEGYNTRGAWSDCHYLSLRELQLPESLTFSLKLKVDHLEYLFNQRNL
ncbi:transposase [Candidatus Omnitrophota bacterium]